MGSCDDDEEESWKGDDYCDDITNNCGCEWDGGDCCGDNVNTDFCSACECLDPNANSGTESSTSTFGPPPTDCQPDWIDDDYCDDGNNNEDCEWDGGDCCGSNVNTQYCSVCECLDPNVAGSRKEKNLKEIISPQEKKQMKKKKNRNMWEYFSLIEHNDRSMQFAKIVKRTEEKSLNPLTKQKSFEEYLLMENEENFRNHYHSRKHISHNTKRSQVHKRSKYSYSFLRKTTIKSNDQTELRNSHVASSKYGLTVILNPKEAEYTNALKNNFVGFKTLVHTPYNFPEVDAVGMAMDKNVQATVGIRGHHSFITDAANALGLYQKKCLSRSDDMNKYKDVKLEVFAYYTKKGCILECHANIFNEKCGCLPYYYPDFSSVWNRTTNCNHTALQCISKLVRKQIFH